MDSVSKQPYMSSIFRYIVIFLTIICSLGQLSIVTASVATATAATTAAMPTTTTTVMTNQDTDQISNSSTPPRSSLIAAAAGFIDNQTPALFLPASIDLMNDIHQQRTITPPDNSSNSPVNTTTGRRTPRIMSPTSISTPIGSPHTVLSTSSSSPLEPSNAVARMTVFDDDSSGSSLSMGMKLAMQAGDSGTLVIAVTNFPYSMSASDIFSFVLPSDSFSMGTSTRCTLPFVSSAQSAAYSTSFAVKVTSAVSSGSSFTISCTNVNAATFGMSSGQEINLSTTLKVTYVSAGSSSEHIYTSFISSNTITAAGMGSGTLPQVALSPDGGIFFEFTAPYSIPQGDSFIVALGTEWYNNAATSCTFHTMNSSNLPQVASDPASRTVATSTAALQTSNNNTMLVITIIIPSTLTASTSYAFFCGNLATPRVNTVATASAGIVSASIGLYRAKTTTMTLPQLVDQVGAVLFNVQLSAWTAGQKTGLAATIERYPQQITKGGAIRLILPSSIQVVEDYSTTCKLTQQQAYNGGLVTIPSTYDYDSDNGWLTFTLSDSNTPITNYMAISQITCDAVIAMASTSGALTNITIQMLNSNTSSSSTPLYQRNDGVLQQIYPAVLGSVSRTASQTATIAGQTTQITINASPINTVLQYGDFIALTFDQNYVLSSSTTCSLYLSNAQTFLLQSSGDINIAIGTTRVVSGGTVLIPNISTNAISGYSNVANTYSILLNITETSSSKQSLMMYTSNNVTIQCQGIINPSFEKVSNPTLDLRMYSPQYGGWNQQLASFSAAILPQITPGTLGTVSASYQPSSTIVNTAVTLYIVVNSLMNSIPTAANSGSIQFTVPSSWTPNAGGQSSCSCNIASCTGTTSIDQTIDYTVTFAPIISLTPDDGNIIFTCTNFRTPSTAQNALTSLTITSYQSSNRIDTTSAATMPAIVATSSDSTSSQVVHSLVLNANSTLTSSQTAVLQVAYAQTFSSLDISATVLKQHVYNGTTFTIPKTFANQTDSSIISMSLPSGSSSSLLQRNHQFIVEQFDDDQNEQNEQHFDDDDDDQEQNEQQQNEQNEQYNVFTTSSSSLSSLSSTPQQHLLSTLGINDVYTFESGSQVLVVATLLTSADTSVTQSSLIQAMNTTVSKQQLSSQISSMLSLDTLYNFAGLKADGSGVLAQHCLDGVKNDDETDIDCGGSCNPCGDGSTCSKNTDCSSGKCKSKTCVASSSSASGKGGMFSSVHHNFETIAIALIFAIVLPFVIAAALPGHDNVVIMQQQLFA